MKSICYILYSKKLDRFYIGSSRFPAAERLDQHLIEFYRNNKSFTTKAKDWEIYFVIDCDTYEIALFVEKYIKKMKSRLYIENLKKYPETVEKIKHKYSMN